MKMFTKTAIVALVFLVSFQITSAAFGQVFGGKITTTTPSEIPEIETVESAGYRCEIPGTTIQVKSKTGLQSLFAPYGIRAKTNTTPATNQSIIGKKGGQTTIVCKRINPDGSTSEQNVILTNITIFGTSRR